MSKKKKVKLTEKDLRNIVKRVIREQEYMTCEDYVREARKRIEVEIGHLQAPNNYTGGTVDERDKDFIKALKGIDKILNRAFSALR